MSSMNKLLLIGYVGKDPEIRYTSDGDPIASFSLATSDKWTDKRTSEKKEKTEWHQVVCYGTLASIASKYITKGKQLYLEGPIHTEEWTDREGKLRKTTKVTARQIVLLGGGTRDVDREHASTGHGSATAKTAKPGWEESESWKGITEPVAAGPNQGEVEGDDDIPF